MKSNSLLTAEVEKINSTLMKDHNTHMRTVIDMEKLGESVVSLKGEMMGNNHEGIVKSLKERTDNLEKEVKSVTSKQLSTIQDITRNTGRLNKVELDIKKINDDVADVEEQQAKTNKQSE